MVHREENKPIERPKRGHGRLNMWGGHEESLVCRETNVRPSNLLHHGSFPVGDGPGAILKYEMKAIVECQQIGDRSLGDNFRVSRPLRVDRSLLLLLFFSWVSPSCFLQVAERRGGALYELRCSLGVVRENSLDKNVAKPSRIFRTPYPSIKQVCRRVRELIAGTRLSAALRRPSHQDVQSDIARPRCGPRGRARAAARRLF